MRKTRRLVVAIGWTVSCAAGAWGLDLALLANRRIAIPMEFSDLQYDASEKGLTGTAIQIAPAECGYRASVRFGDGPGTAAPDFQAHDVELWPEGEAVGVAELGTGPYADLRFTIDADSGHAGSFLGLVWRDHLEGVFHFANGRALQVRLPLLIIQPTGTLRGLPGVAVSAFHQDSGDVSPPPGFEASVKARLRMAGIPILQYDNDVPGQPLLQVIIADQEDRVDLELRQDVWLDRDPRIKASAVTWSFGWRISAEDRATARVPAFITDRFVKDYLEANRSIPARGVQ